MGNSVSDKIRSGFPALQHRNFRLFWFGQCISLIGTWMQNIGQSWLVLEMTHSALKLSIVTTVQFLPVTLFSLWAGTLADRFPKRTMLICTQSVFAVLAAVLATLTWTGAIEYWHVLILALLLGAVSTIDMPTRQSFVIELVGKEDLPNAIALNSSVFNLGRILGPAVAGLLIGLIGIAPCFYLNAFSFIAIVINLLMIRVPAREVRQAEFGMFKTVFIDIRDGLRYISHKEMIKQPLILLAFISTFVINFNIIVPVFAQQELSQNATGFGLLMTSMGIGSFIASLTMVARSRKNPKLRYLVGAAFFTSAFLLLLALERNFHLALFTMLFIGFYTVSFTTLVNTTVQLHSSNEMRGRVMSVFILVYGGMTPIGSLLTGQIIEFAGVRGCMAISGIIGILAVAWSIFAMRRKHTGSQSIGE
ncbi:MAG TPA: MFS transporter [Anaerovoracaceae bacterium]|nr:MFS transporter [Anaerovoracaceae bacterium]